MGSDTKKLEKILQRMTLYPMIVGIIVCTTLALTILIKKQMTWLSLIQSTLDLREQEHLISLALSRSQKIAGIINSVSFI